MEEKKTTDIKEKAFSDFEEKYRPLNVELKNDALVCALFETVYARVSKITVPNKAETVVIGDGWNWLKNGVLDHGILEKFTPKYFKAYGDRWVFVNKEYSHNGVKSLRSTSDEVLPRPSGVVIALKGDYLREIRDGMIYRRPYDQIRLSDVNELGEGTLVYELDPIEYGVGFHGRDVKEFLGKIGVELTGEIKDDSKNGIAHYRIK